MDTKFRTEFSRWLTDTCCLNEQEISKVVDNLAITEKFCDSKNLLPHSIYSSIDYEEIDRICDALLLEMESQYHMTIDALIQTSEELRNCLYELNDYLVSIADRTTAESTPPDTKTTLDDNEILAELEMISPKTKILTAGTLREFFGDFSEEEQRAIVRLALAAGYTFDEKNNKVVIGEDLRKQNSATGEMSDQSLMHLSNEMLCVAAQQGNKEALSALYKKNVRFIYRKAIQFAKIYSRSSLELDDFLQEGYIGFFEAVKRFDEKQENKLLTYAGYWIFQAMSRAVANEGYTIRLPVHMWELVIKVHRERHQHTNLTIDQLLDLLHKDGCSITREKLLECIKYEEQYLQMTSLNKLVGQKEDTEILDSVPDENPSVEDLLQEKLHKEELPQRYFSVLSERERRILMYRMGFIDGVAHTLEETGEKEGVTRERIRQIEQKALRKMLKEAKRNGDYDVYKAETIKKMASTKAAQTKVVPDLQIDASLEHEILRLKEEAQSLEERKDRGSYRARLSDGELTILQYYIGNRYLNLPEHSIEKVLKDYAVSAVRLRTILQTFCGVNRKK